MVTIAAKWSPNITIAANVKPHKSTSIQWAPIGRAPNVSFTYRTHLSDEKRVSKIWYLFLSQKYNRF